MIARGTEERRREPEGPPAELRSAEKELLEHIKLSEAINPEEVVATLIAQEFVTISHLLKMENLLDVLRSIGIKGYSAGLIASYCAKYTGGGGS